MNRYRVEMSPTAQAQADAIAAWWVATEACQRAEQVDAEAARRDLSAADEKLRAWSRETGAEFDRAVMDRAWAEARLRVAESRRD